MGFEMQTVAVIGPFQTGKTTLVGTQFPDKPYIYPKNADSRRFAMEDSRGFLSTYPKGAILYEVKRTPEIFSYFQEILDALEGGSQYLGWMIP